jgi:hypothetical protein
MWAVSHGFAIPNVSGLIYNNPMNNELVVRCNMCDSLFEYEVMDCNICLTDDYLMDLSVVPATITSNNERE